LLNYYPTYSIIFCDILNVYTRAKQTMCKGGYLYLHITCGISTMRFERSEYYS